MIGYRPGEYVDITIRGARVRPRPYEDTSQTMLAALIELPGTTGHAIDLLIGTGAGAVSVERVAPAGWPPQPGDLWRDADGNLWFGLEDRGAVQLYPAHPRLEHDPARSPGHLLAHSGPMTLEYRPAAREAVH